MSRNYQYIAESDRILKELGQVFSEYRKTRGLSQRQMAERLGVTQSLVSKLESGTYNANIRLLCELAERMNLSVIVKLG